MEHQVPDPQKALIETLNAAFLENKLEDALRRHWSLHLLEVIRPEKNPRELKYDKGHLWRLLLEPVEAFIAGSDQPAEKFATLKKEDSFCNRRFCPGELIYRCRDCAVNLNCVLCIECFKQSAHKNHRYCELGASDGGYCDCGNPELWKKDYACAQHQPPVDLKDVNFNLEDARIRVPRDISRRFTEAIQHALCYVYQVLTFRDGVLIPPDLACPSPSEDPFPFVTILYNDEVDSYDDVIKTLTLALECTQEDASEYATVIDHEGRCPVKFGSKGECERVREEFVERDLKRQQPLRLDVVQTAAYAHQVFALKVLTWIQGLAEKCEGFRALICDVCLQASPAGGDHPIVSSFLLEDVRLWKTARKGCRSLFTATFLIFNDAKVEFFRLLVLLYTHLMTKFISDNYDYSDLCTSLTCQYFTVPIVARTLFSDSSVEVIMKSFVLSCQSRKNDQGRLSFDKATQPATEAQLERDLYAVIHVLYLLNTVPTSHQWTDALRKGFIGTFEQFLQIMIMMEGMDDHTHWEFDMQRFMGGIINLLQPWCTSNDKVLSICTEKLLTAALTSLHAVVTSHAVMSEEIEKIVKTEKKEVASCSFDCVEYDVSTQFVSIHHPVIRMLAGLVVPALAKKIVLEVSGGSVPIEEHLKLHARELLELPLRTMVLVAQARRGMWGSKGNAFYDQILSYQDPEWRGGMLDKDIVMMQACAAVMPPDSFLIALLDKFAVLPWADETFDATPVCVEDDSIRRVMCLAEHFLLGLIVLVGERFYPGVGRVTEDDCLKNEVIHQLCRRNMSYSELLQYLPDQEAKSSLDELIKEVSVLEEPSPTEDNSSEEDDSSEKGDIYGLKAESTERFNLFFYRYNEIERSEAKDTQRKRREKTQEEVVFAPPCPPPFSDAFSRIVHLLDCDVFIHLLKLTVRRALLNHPRFCFDDQLVRMLYLVGYALDEEKRQRISNNNTNTNDNNKFKFLEIAADAGVFVTLRELRVRSHNETYQGLLEWVLHFYDDLTKQESVDSTEAPPVDSVGDAGDDDVDEKKRRSATRREQMEDAQISFASQDVGDLKKIALPDDVEVTAAPYKPFGTKKTISYPDEDLMQLSSASMLQQIMDGDDSSGIAAIAVGIDFGAANIRVGRWIDGRFESITDKSGEDAIPAFFSRKDGRDFFGQEAREMSTIEPANVIFDVMQFLGLGWTEICYKLKKGWPFDVDSSINIYFVLPGGSQISLFEVIQCFLERVHMQCEKLFGLQEFSLALTVPSYWHTSMRQYREKNLLDAARRSGFTRVSLMESQVAAMLGCCLGMKDSKTWLKDILIVDIGAIDITASVFRTQLESETKTEDGTEDNTEDETKNKTEDKTMTKTFTVTGTGLGCASVDQALMRYLKNQFVIQHKIPLKTTIEIISWHRLRMECEKARICLSSALTTVLFVPNFAVGYDLHVELTRDTFDDVVGSTIADDVVGITEQVLDLSKINLDLSTKDDFRLFLVGGGSRIPCIRQRMDSEFGSKIGPVALLHREDAGVYGAAGYARIIALEPDVGKHNIVQHYRDLCDLFENDGKPWEGDGIAGLASCHLACTHTFTKPAVAFFDRMTPIICSIQGITINTDRVSYRFSIRGRIAYWGAFFMCRNHLQLQHIKLTQATAASLQLQQSYMVMLSSEGTLEQENLTGTGAFGNFKGPPTMIRNPLDLCHPNVVRYLAVGHTVSGSEGGKMFNKWPRGEKWMRLLLDMRLDLDSFDHLSPSSEWDITLHRFCKERSSSLGNKEIIHKTKQLLEGLSYLHGLKIPFILASLTSFGILVTADGETVKIWDIVFGLLDKSPPQLRFEVSSDITIDLWAYAHPDVSDYMLEVSRDYRKCSTLTFQPYMDIWSLGCVVLDMVSRGHHFICIDKHGVLLDNRIRTQDFVRTMTEGGVPLIPSTVPDIIQQLCGMCFEHKPDRRTDALGLLAIISQIPENEIDVCSRDKASL